MSKILLSIGLALLCFSAFAQRLSQYNTGTLYDAFENPSQAVFLPDSSRTIAFNFLIPNLNAYGFLRGNAQTTLKSRAFLGDYNSSALQIGQAQPNKMVLNTNVYWLMLRILSNQNGDQELGLSVQTKFNGRGIATDESFALLDRYSNFAEDNYSNIFNDHGYYEGFHQISFTYREKVTKDFWIGAKLSGLLGIVYNKFNVTESSLAFDQSHNNAELGLGGTYRSTYVPFDFRWHDLWPTLKNPGAAISIGATYKAPANILIQGNIKDLGFIHWADANSYLLVASNTATIHNMQTNSRQTNVINAVSTIINRSHVEESFATPIEGRAELAVSRKFIFNDDLSYTPVGIVSKTLFHLGATTGLVNHIQFKSFVLTATGSYSDYEKSTNIGGQLMFKKPNFEIYIGSDQIGKTANAINSATGSLSAINQASAYSAANVYLGCSIKFGRMFERWRNTDYIPTGGESGPLGRLWTKLFNSN